MIDVLMNQAPRGGSFAMDPTLGAALTDTFAFSW